ncbi:MAG: TonB-dependent receptor [Bryobacterales bacterium]
MARRQTNGFEADTHRGSHLLWQCVRQRRHYELPPRPAEHLFHRHWRRAPRLSRLVGRNLLGDHWRASTKLDLSVGLRYELMGAPSEVNHLDPVPYDCDCNNLAPTFGFAYRLPPSLGLIRAAFGIHYATLLPVTYQQGRYNAPGNVKQIIQQPNLVDPLAGFDPSNLAGVQSVRYNLDPELAAPYSMQYNFSWELEPSRGWNLSLGYVGSRSPKLLSQWYLNRAEARRRHSGHARNRQ